MVLHKLREEVMDQVMGELLVASEQEEVILDLAHAMQVVVAVGMEEELLVGEVVDGGSGYVLTSSSSKPSGYALGSQYYLSNASTKAGNTSFVSPTGGNETGHSGNGYARITLVE